MKKVIAIVNDSGFVQEEELNNGVGGSETWIIEIAKKFAEHGYYIMVFSQDPKWIYYPSNVEYIPMNLLEFKLRYMHFEHIIICRYIYSTTLNILSNYTKHINKISWMVHDTEINVDLTLPKTYQELLDNHICLKEKFHKFICLSTFAKNILQQYLPDLPDNKIVLIGNGISFNYQIDESIVRDNNFLCSSRWERGLELFVHDIFPYIKEKFPESKIYVAQYENTLPEHLLNNKNIVFLGKLSKEDLYKEMAKHKVAFYPNFYPETFCITILENVLCGNEILTSFNYGPATTLRYFKSLLLPENCDYSDPKMHKIIAKIIVNSLINYYNINHKNIRNIMKNYILEEYSWENIFNKFENYIING